jgi:hypothetical protein
MRDSGDDEAEKVELENDQVKVLRIKVRPGEKRHHKKRGDRVLVWLTDSHHKRTGQDGKSEDLRRGAGQVAWRSASEHHIESLHGETSELLIIELKPRR